MKVRLGFVTNSSSSSFIISKKYLDDDQISAIWNHIELSKKMGIEIDTWDSWEIEENNEFIAGYVVMDNFSMYDFLNDIDIDLDIVTWGVDPFDLNSWIDKTNNNHNKKKSWRGLLHED